jgi:hypothetical protein
LLLLLLLLLLPLPLLLLLPLLLVYVVFWFTRMVGCQLSLRPSGAIRSCWTWPSSCWSVHEATQQQLLLLTGHRAQVTLVLPYKSAATC